jgi:hypothetical protein
LGRFAILFVLVLLLSAVAIGLRVGSINHVGTSFTLTEAQLESNQSATPSGNRLPRWLTHTAEPNTLRAEDASDGERDGNPQTWITEAENLFSQLPPDVEIDSYRWAGSLAELGKGNIDAELLRSGESFAAMRCGACHLLPAPAVLPKLAWVELFHYKYRVLAARKILNVYISPSDRLNLLPIRSWAGRRGLWDPPYEEFTIPTMEFARIMYAYLAVSPLKISPVARIPEISGQAGLVLTFPQMPEKTGQYGYSAVAYDAATNRILLGDPSTNELIVLGAAFRLLGKFPLGGSPVHIASHAGSYYVTEIGEQMGPSHLAEGRLVRFSANIGDYDPLASNVVLDRLARPVRAHFQNLSGEGFDDILIPEFGWSMGSLSWYRRSLPDENFELHRRLLDGSGAIGVATGDFTGNGLHDVVGLMSQAEETLYLLPKDKDFSPVALVQRSPETGSNSLHAADLNGDGYLDIITTNGDNDDLTTQPLKPYHGVNIYINKGQGDFEKPIFYAFPGAIQVATGDFTGNGRIDIAAISYFPPPQLDGRETFVLLENTGQGFRALRVPGTETLPWIAMAVGDVTRNGRPDIILSYYGSQQSAEREKTPYVVILNNLGRAK